MHPQATSSCKRTGAGTAGVGPTLHVLPEQAHLPVAVRWHRLEGGHARDQCVLQGDVPLCVQAAPEPGDVALLQRPPRSSSLGTGGHA